MAQLLEQLGSRNFLKDSTETLTVRQQSALSLSRSLSCTFSSGLHELFGVPTNTLLSFSASNSFFKVQQNLHSLYINLFCQVSSFYFKTKKGIAFHALPCIVSFTCMPFVLPHYTEGVGDNMVSVTYSMFMKYNVFGDCIKYTVLWIL